MNGTEVCPRVGWRDEWYGGVPQGGMRGGMNGTEVCPRLV